MNINDDDETAAHRALSQALRSLEQATESDADREAHLAQAHILTASALQDLSRWSRLRDLFRERSDLFRSRSRGGAR